MAIETRICGLDWDRITHEIDRRGWATTGPLLTLEERQALVGAYARDELYRSTVVMSRHGFGQGEYRYFAYPLPPVIPSWRSSSSAPAVRSTRKLRVIKSMIRALTCQRFLRGQSRVA